MRPDIAVRAEAQRAARRRKLLEAAAIEARATGYTRMTRVNVTAIAGLSTGSVNHEFGTMAGLREEVMRQAVAAGDLIIIAQGLAAGDAIAKNATPELRAAAVAHLI